MTYAAAAFLPRPMASLTVSDETVLAADFHSPTAASHDRRKGWTDGDVRAWERAYVDGCVGFVQVNAVLSMPAWREWFTANIVKK